MKYIDFLSRDAFRIIDALVENKYYLRELAEELKLPPSSVHNILQKLLAEKMVLEKMQKNRKVYSVNYESPLMREVITLGITKRVLGTKALKKLTAQKPHGIYLFGTAATGRVNGNSDVDVAAYFEKKPSGIFISGVNRALSEELKRETQLIVLTKEKLAAMKKENVELQNQIRNKSITLWGEELE